MLWLRRIGAETHLYAGENAVFEAKKTATLKGGRSWINLDASGVAVGGARIMLGGGATGTARKAPSPQLPEVSPTYEDDFTIQWGDRPKDLSPKERLLLCLPDIAAAEMERQTSKEDKQGWLYLREMLLRWFSRRTDTGIQPYGEEPFWVDWDWVMAYPYAHTRYKVFTNSLYEATPHILNAAARQKLGDILKREGYLRDERTNFDFISTPWEDWERLYHTLISIPRRRKVDGLMAALAGFTLRALAVGYTQPLGGGRWRITVTDISVFVHDKFNFDKESSVLAEFLGLWSCKYLTGAKLFPDEIMDKVNHIFKHLFQKFIENLISGFSIEELIEEMLKIYGFAPLLNGDFQDFRKKEVMVSTFLYFPHSIKLKNFVKQAMKYYVLQNSNILSSYCHAC